MQKNFLSNESFPLFLQGLAASGDLHGPVLTDDGVMAFRPICSPADIQLDCIRTLIPPKKYFFPPKEAILTYSPVKGYQLTKAAGKKVILFGLHPCDLAGIAYLDRVFLESQPDPLFVKRRKAVTLIGLSCEPDEYCFCGTMGTAEPQNFDIFMHRTEAGFYLSAGSSRGKKIIRRLSVLLEAREPPSPVPCECKIEETILQAATRGETFSESRLWEDFAGRCLSCGACSLCCPTCYCFDVQERGRLDGETAERLREWDNCLFKSHGEVAGGHNFRKTREERFRYRFQHKYLGFGPMRGIVSCVGCGRCRDVCPVKIDLMELFREKANIL
ncbi:MAG: 4Fe-4S [Geobacteraceae bacterium]|nr:MAG: 4Fe-4S [Geobacteraceae bacterium]